jgi:hypothetical protein
VRRLALLLVAMAAFVTIAGLYATGPAWKTTTRCSPPSESLFRPAGHGYGTRGGGCSTFRDRTNAWERFKGAITGNP